MPNAKKTPAKATPKKKETPIEAALRRCNSHLKELDYETALKVIAQLKPYYLKNIPPAKGLK